MAMFQPPARPQGKIHAELKAGRCDYDGKMITPDKRKGKIVLFTSEEEDLMHFQWHDREKSEVVQDLIVINDAYFQKIEKCKDGRVYILRFTSSDKKLFFWMQEPKEETDHEVIQKFNAAIGAKIPEKAVGGGAASTGAAAAGAAAAGGQPPLDPAIQAALQQFLQNQGANAGPRTPPLPMTAVLTPEVLQSLMDDEAAVAEMSTLAPEGHSTPEALRNALGSPQLQQSLRALTQAVHSDQLPVLFSSLGLDPSAVSAAAPGSDALEVLCRAMERSLGPNGGGSSGAGGSS